MSALGPCAVITRVDGAPYQLGLVDQVDQVHDVLTLLTGGRCIGPRGNHRLVP